MMKDRKHSRIKTIMLVLLIILIVICCISLIVMALLMKGRNDMTSGMEVEVAAPQNLEVASENNGQTVVYNGEIYHYNPDVTNILCIGVDRDNLEEKKDIGYGGQADSLFLAAMDTRNRKFSIIGLSRDSMVEIDIYDTEGKLVDKRVEQLCLSYAYGNGKDTSCENTVNAVSRLLYGIPVHAYAAIDMDAIGELNDLVGGVTLDPGEDRKYFDFSNVDGNLVTLNGFEAEVFVRFRDITDLESNNYRIGRQKKYLLAFANTVLEKTKEDLTTPVKLYQEISDDIVTSLSISDISYLASQAIKCEISMDNLTVIQGEVRSDGVHAEFYPDETMLYELILETYYYKE